MLLSFRLTAVNVPYHVITFLPDKGMTRMLEQQCKYSLLMTLLVTPSFRDSNIGRSISQHENSP